MTASENEFTRNTFIPVRNYFIASTYEKLIFNLELSKNDF